MGDSQCFSYNPYDTSCSQKMHDDVSSVSSVPRSAQSTPPPSPQAMMHPHSFHTSNITHEEKAPRVTNHLGLIDCASFIPFPDDFFDPLVMARNNDPLSPRTKSGLCRLFFGQLPYDVFEGQVKWLVQTLTGGLDIFGMERIVRWKNNRQPSGCVHVYCRAEDADEITNAVNNNVLFDDSGLWIADNEDEMAALVKYCTTMKECKELRPFQRPYQMVSAERATSNYVPRARQIRVVQRDAEFMTHANNSSACVPACAPAGLYKATANNNPNHHTADRYYQEPAYTCNTYDNYGTASPAMYRGGQQW